MVTAVELGLLYAIMALGVYLTFRILEFADLTVDGSFTTGAAVVAVAIVKGYDPLVATAAAFVAGLMAGTITGVLHTKANIDGLLAGILTQIGLYSINLRIMGAANLSLLREETLFSSAREAGQMGTTSWVGPAMLAPIALVVLVVIIWFLHTDLGLAMRATGDNSEMIRSFGVSTDAQKILGLALSNGLVALSGGLVAQYQGFADVGMGIGMIVAGLASVIIGQAIFGRLTVFRAASAVVFGAVLYRVVIQLALEVGLNPNDMKLISAILVVLALVLPQVKFFKHVPGRFKPRNGRSPDAAGIPGDEEPPGADSAAVFASTDAGGEPAASSDGASTDSASMGGASSGSASTDGASTGGAAADGNGSTSGKDL